ncbi:unnamed protein product [Caretta caretta]
MIATLPPTLCPGKPPAAYCPGSSPAQPSHVSQLMDDNPPHPPPRVQPGRGHVPGPHVETLQSPWQGGSPMPARGGGGSLGAGSCQGSHPPAGQGSSHSCPRRGAAAPPPLSGGTEAEPGWADRAQGKAPEPCVSSQAPPGAGRPVSRAEDTFLAPVSLRSPPILVRERSFTIVLSWRLQQPGRFQLNCASFQVTVPLPPHPPKKCGGIQDDPLTEGL